jgi:lambda family phage tail tape measure protein
MATIGSLSVKLGLVTVEWDQATEKAKKQAKDLQTAFNELGQGFSKAMNLWKELGPLMGAVSIVGLIAHTIELTAQVKDLSNAFGISVQETLAFQNALMGAGADAENAAKMMSSLFGKIDDAQQGNDKTIAQFEKLGISFAELKSTSPYDMIVKVAKGFEEVTNQAEKAKLIKELFGKSGIQLDIKDVSEALEEGTKRFDKNAEAIKILGEVSDNLKKNLFNLSIAFSEFLAPLVSGGTTSIEKFSLILNSLATGAVAFGIAKIAVAFFELGRAIMVANAAGVAFNFTAGGTNPIGIAIKLLAAGAAAIVYFKGAPEEDTGNADWFKKQQEKYGVTGVTPTPIGQTAEDIKAEKDKADLEIKSVANKASQVQLTYQLIKLDGERQKIQSDFLYQDALVNQLALSRLTTKEKIAQIDSKLAQELKTMADNVPQALIAQTKELANAEKLRVIKEGTARESLLKAKDEYAIRQRLLASETEFIKATVPDQEEDTPVAREERARAKAMELLGIRNTVTEQGRLTDLANQRLKLENQLTDVMPRQKDLLLEEYDLAVKISEYRLSANKKGEGALEIEAMVEIMQKAGEETIRLKQLNIDAQRTFESGWTQAYNSFMDNATNASIAGRDVFNAFTNNMTSAIDNFVKTGKLSFASLARSIIQDLIAIQLKASVLSMFKGLFGGKYTEGSSSFVGPSLDYGSGDLFKASGGNVTGDTPYIVGEQGPELFIPNKSGAIAPNNSLAGMGSNKITNININAIDTKSFEDRLLNSPNAIWAANQYANKSLAIGRGRS